MLALISMRSLELGQKVCVLFILTSFLGTSGNTFSSRPSSSLVLKALTCNYFTDITRKKKESLRFVVLAFPT